MDQPADDIDHLPSLLYGLEEEDDENYPFIKPESGMLMWSCWDQEEDEFDIQRGNLQTPSVAYNDEREARPRTLQEVLNYKIKK